MVWLPYFDKPDGEDCFYKVWYASKTCGKFGLLFGGIDVFMYTKSPTIFDGLVRGGYYWMVPLVTMGAATAAVTCSLANIRKKDDPFNYLVGGFAGGSVWGATYRSVPVGLSMGAVVAICAALLKISHRDNWNSLINLDNMHKQYGTFSHHTRDYSLRNDPKDAKKQI